MTQPIIWTIAGSDSGGGAGIQADLKTFNALGTYGCSVITALTAQNTQGVIRTEATSMTMLQDQLAALKSDLPPSAVKIGMIGAVEQIEIIANTIRSLNTFTILDPVMISTSGNALFPDNALQTLKQDLLPHISLLTPNLHEAEQLTGITIQNTQQMEQAARIILSFGVRSVLIKGGHLPGAISQDFWSNGTEKWWLNGTRIETRHSHGTGCTLSAAIAVCIGLGLSEQDALIVGKAYVSQGLRLAPQLGHGCGPLTHAGWPETHEDLPWLSPTAETGLERLKFPDCGETPLGFYPIVDRFKWLEKLLPLGVSTIQLRIKDLQGEELEREIAQASAYAKLFNCRLFVNDYWQLALKYGAYGVHLGQDDLETADLNALSQAGIRLGISTHCYQEVARALAIRPSYIAIGPVFHTTTKAMRFVPQGLDAVRRWRRSLPYPLVAIAGIFLENAPAVLETGVDGVAVVRDIVQANDLPFRVRQWQTLFNQVQAQQPPPARELSTRQPSPLH